MNRVKMRWLRLVAAVLLVIVAGQFMGGGYTPPAGYRDAAGIWRELGLAAREMPADGSEALPFDVVVWGSDPEGIAAAVAAARNGLQTLLVDRRDRVGGLFTLGQLNKIDMNYGLRKFLGRRAVTRGIFEEFQIKVGGTVFDIDDAQRVFEQMVGGEPLLTVALERELAGVQAENGRVTALHLVRNGASKPVYGRVFIDASQDADMAYLAGAPFTKGFADIGMPGKHQVSTLVFALDGVNWYRVMWETLVADRRRTSAATLRAAWGYDTYVQKYVPENERIAFRGFNMVRQKDGQVFINGLLIYDLDPLQAGARDQARAEAVRELDRFVKFARENLPGFGEATVSGVAPELYVRESRHLEALYRLTIDDVLENRDQWDRIGYGSYPVDIQAMSKHQPGFIVGAPEMYAVPFRSLVPPNLHNLLVVGRSAGFDSLAHGSARVVPVGMTAGQAAGVAAAYSLAAGMGFIEIAGNQRAVAFIQDVLARQGAFVEPNPARAPALVADPAYPAVKALRRLGLVSGGYNNDYRLDEPLSSQAFLNIIFHGSARALYLAGEKEAARWGYFVTAADGGVVTGENVERLLAEFVRFNPYLQGFLLEGTVGERWEMLAERGGNGIPRRELYEAIWHYLDNLKQPGIVGWKNF